MSSSPEDEIGPSQAGNALGILEQAREASEFRFPILLPALLDQPVGRIGSDHPVRVIGGSAQHPHRVVMGEDHVADRLVGDPCHPRDHVARHGGRGLRIDDHAAILGPR